MEELDSNKLIAEIISANAENLFDASKKFLSDKGNQLKARLNATFSKYIEGIERKYSSTKTIIYRDTPQSIKLFYEPIDLFNDTITLHSPQTIDLTNLKKPIVITGTGGSGKSTFLKHLLLNSLEFTKLIPIFVELRNVEQAKLSLVDYIYSNLQLNKVDLGSEYLDQAFNRGNFLFLLDGFDELSPMFAHEIGREIDHISQIYSKCNFIITSRPGQDFISWPNFIELRTQPLSLEKAISLVKRLNFDSEVKENFIAELGESLYDTHQSFFENPLLLSIMLITYRDSASIPSELHNFYSLAFEALYYRHDASKSFSRPTLTNLPINKGKDIMSAFSIITYLKTQTSFNDFELKDLLTKAIKLADCDCELKDLITDLLRAFCMLLQDGTMYEFTHRSFQEYFAACYLISTNESNQSQLIAEFSKRADTDITLQLAYGMNPKMIEEKLIMPFLAEFKEKIGFEQKINDEVFVRFANMFFDTITFYDEVPTLTVSNEKIEGFEKKRLDLRVTRLILRIYNIDTNYKETERGKGITGKKTDAILTSNIKRNDEAFKWLVKYSLEARVLSELLRLEKLLRDKNIRNNELFDSLFSN